jgi:diguanylate cyclase (GGDEF)-like protein
MISQWFKKKGPAELTTWESAWKKLGYHAVSVPRIYTLSPGTKESAFLETELERCERLLMMAESPRDLDRAGVMLQDVTERHAKSQQNQVDTLIDGLSNSIRLLVNQISETGEKHESSLDDLASVEVRLRQATEAPTLDQTKAHLADAIRSVGRVVERQAQVFESLREQSESAKNFLAQELKKAEEQGRTDALTRIGNRVSFDFYSAGIQSKVQSGEGPFSLANFDLDGFKAINDTHGHAVGDEALLSFAERLRQSLGDKAFLARFGGDEFVAIVAMEEDVLLGRCKRLAESMDKRPTVLVSQGKSYTVQLGASYGVCQLSAQRPLAESMSLADQRMYAFKKERKEKKKAA